MKKPSKKSKLEELDTKQQMLEKKLLQAYTAGMGYHIIDQLRQQIDLNRMDMYDESEKQKFEWMYKPDGEIMDSSSDEEKKRRDDDYIA